MDTDLLLLIAVCAFAVWVLAVVWQYAKLQTRKSLAEQDEVIFWKGVPPESQRFRLAIIPRATSAQSFFVILAIAVLAGVLARTFGLI